MANVYTGAGHVTSADFRYAKWVGRTKGGKAVAEVTPLADKISVGDTVKVKKGAKTYTGAWLASFVYDRKHKVLELKGDRAVITYEGVVVAAVKLVDLVKA